MLIILENQAILYRTIYRRIVIQKQQYIDTPKLCIVTPLVAGLPHQDSGPVGKFGIRIVHLHTEGDALCSVTITSQKPSTLRMDSNAEGSI